MKKAIVLILVFFTAFELAGYAQAKQKAEKQTKVLIHTDMGDIKILLYNETPKHRDNFIKLVKEGWYNGSPWHRVIKGFMVQAGRNKDGKEEPGYTTPAEFISTYYHKRGALAAARTGDQVNPAKASSGSQFYIVQGNKFDDATLTAIETRMNKKLSEQQKTDYRTIGGAPHLDGEYTIFGEVIYGMDIVDKIAAVEVDQMSKPLKDIKMTMKIIE
jgi:peptidyl-prolyl cis-trans isomerase B (cyclophilin B)